MGSMRLLLTALFLLSISFGERMASATEVQAGDLQVSTTCEPNSHTFSIGIKWPHWTYGGEGSADGHAYDPDDDIPDKGLKKLTTCVLDDKISISIYANRRTDTVATYLNGLRQNVSSIGELFDMKVSIYEKGIVNLHECQNYVEPPGYVRNIAEGDEANVGDVYLESFCESYTAYDETDADPLTEKVLGDYWRSAGESASFNCDFAKEAIEKLICSSKRLAWLDRAMAGQFWRLENSGDRDQTLIAEQRQWLGKRVTACRVPKGAIFENLPDDMRQSIISCLKGMYLHRMKDFGERRFAYVQAHKNANRE